MEAVRMVSVAFAIFPLICVALAMGKLFSTWMDSVARNPEAEDKIRSAGMIGAAFTESIGLFAFIVALLILFK